MRERIVLTGIGFVVALVALPPIARSQTNLPDLIVDQESLRQHWVVRVEDLLASFCSVQEGEVTPGERTLLRFTVSTPNNGAADLVVGDPNQRPDLFEFATCHNHHHFKNYALYQLVDANTGQVWKAAKRGFCMLDLEKYKAYSGGAQPDNKPHFQNCGLIGVPGNQGISAGWSDIYIWKLGGQYFVLDGGDNQPVVPPGDYIIRITVNPPYVPQGPCANLDSNGMCHTLPESNYDNNIAEVRITIPPHPGRQGVGPLKDQPASASEPIDNT
jgi:hypothetical protein